MTIAIVTTNQQNSIRGVHRQITIMAGEDDERHRREEQERRAKRKASKSSRSEAQLEKERKRKEYRQEVLRKHGAPSAAGSSASKRPKTAAEKPQTSSAFQELFTQRAQGFQIDFRFRNAPPRPPVGPCFVGYSLNAVLLEHSRTYKAQNAIELNHTWKLHNEPDVGVPLAPSAMNLKFYEKVDESADAAPPMHPDDAALIHWTGSMGDTAAENWKRRQEKARAAARLAASGRSPPPKAPAVAVLSNKNPKKKAFSRVLREDHQTWMKKTTYLSNDYSRKVHDFKSLAQTKSELAADLEAKQREMTQRRSVKAITESFTNIRSRPLVHPTNKALKPVKIMQVLPDVANWGRAFTHVVVDKAPTNLPPGHTVRDLQSAFLTNVEKRSANEKMTCQLIVPAVPKEGDDADAEKHNKDRYDPIQSYDLDVIPLKEHDDAPHANFCLWLDRARNVARYVPVASRVQLSTGRPPTSSRNAAAQQQPRTVHRRPVTDAEREATELRAAEVDADLAEKHHVEQTGALADEAKETAANGDKPKDRNDDGEGDFGDDDDSSSDEEVFGSGAKTIVAES